VFTTVGVDPAIEFLAADAQPPREDPPQHRAFPREATTEALLARILRAAPLSAPFEDLARDARLAALELDAHVRGLTDRQPVDAVEVARPVFDRGEGAYLVDVFPEELLPFLGLTGRLREVFLRAHGELLTGRWWRDIQARLRAGEIVDIFPYREEQRLRHARP
jgi:isocitrate dehydrogenase kinase/phosphatase